jgi:hypothetical protein
MKQCLLLVGLWLALVGLLPAQTTLQVVSKNIRKTVDWRPDMTLVINCEKADIVVEPVDSGFVQVQAELSARHPSLDTATADLDTWQWVLDRVGKKLYIRAYIGVPSGRHPPASSMRARVVIRAPRSCALELTNKYGKARLDNWTGGVVLNGTFCHFELRDLSGHLRLESQYSDLRATDLRGEVSVEAKRSDLHFDDLHAHCRIRAEYGSVTVSPAPDLAQLAIEANKSAIILLRTAELPHAITATTQNGHITAPTEFDKQSPTDQSQSAYRPASSSPSPPPIKVSTSFADIILSR